MFTGLVCDKATLVNVEAISGGVRLTLAFPEAIVDWEIGESVALNGCCLTAVAMEANRVSFEAGKETLEKTTLGKWKPMDQINFERSLLLTSRLGGHFLSGHIDGIGTILHVETIEEVWRQFRVQVPQVLASQIASKGSIGLDGVSLTVNDVDDNEFSVFLIPHTLERTNLRLRQPGDRVNLETDILAKYAQRAIYYQASAQHEEQASHE